MDDHIPIYLNVSNPPQALTNPHGDGEDSYTFSVVFEDTEPFPCLGQTFTTGDGNFSSNPSSTYSSPGYVGLGDSFDAIGDDQWSPLSPHPTELWAPDAARHLVVPHSIPRRYSESGESSTSSLGSSTDMFPGLRRHASASLLGIRRNDQPISEMLSNVKTLSLEDNPPHHGPASSPVAASSPYGGNTAFLIPIQTPANDGLPFRSPASSAPSSPISPSSSLAPPDGRAGMGNVSPRRTRSTKSIQASLSRRKGPGKFVCNNCGDDFTTKHRLNGHIASKHEGIKMTCPSCDAVLSHVTSYDRHLKQTCPVLHPRGLRNK